MCVKQFRCSVVAERFLYDVEVLLWLIIAALAEGALHNHHGVDPIFVLGVAVFFPFDFNVVGEVSVEKTAYTLPVLIMGGELFLIFRGLKRETTDRVHPTIAGVAYFFGEVVIHIHLEKIDPWRSGGG